MLIVDPAKAVVKELKMLLEHLNEWEQSGLIESPPVTGKKPWRARYFVSGDPELFRQVGNTLLHEQIGHVEQVVLGE